MSDKLPPKILVVEADEALKASLCNAIERYWFDVNRAGEAAHAFRLAEVNMPHIAIISSRVIDVSAINIAKKLRSFESSSQLPIIFLLDKDESPTSYNALDNGLIEVINRPFTPNELMIAIKSLLRRSKPVYQDKILRYKDLTMDLATFKVTRSNKNIYLGPTEFKILQLLMKSSKTIFSRQQIIDYVWGTNQIIEKRTVDVHVNRLRNLIKVKEDDVQFIKTVRSSGYCLNLPGEIV